MTSVIERPLLDARAWSPVETDLPDAAPGPHRSLTRPVVALCLGLTAVGQVVLSRVVHPLPTAFQDEGLYIYMGHRILDALRGGEPIFEYPGAYFSGAPGFYPVLAALADDLGGLQGVRDLSLAFVVVTMLATYGIGAQLFGRLAGVLGAVAFAACGSVVYVSQWATFDALTMMLAASAACLTVWGARRDGLLVAPVVALVLAAAVLAKYAGMMYVPVVAALAVAVGWRRFRWAVVGRAAFLGLATAALLYFVIMVWGRGLIPGLVQTTTDRSILYPARPADLAVQVVDWVGPWLGLALLGGLARLRSHPVLVLVLLGGSVLGPLQQVHLGEATSLSKHVAFGMVFAAPLAGDLMSRLLRWHRATAVVVLAVLAGLVWHGLTHATVFLADYPDDRQFQTVLRQAVAANPDKPMLAEQSSAQRYELRRSTTPTQWVDTYGLTYDGRTGVEAYRRAISDHYFGVIYLNFTTPASHQIITMLNEGQDHDRYYHLVAKVPGYIHGASAGYWLMWTPQDKQLTSIR